MFKRVMSVLSAMLLVFPLLMPAYADETEIVGLGTHTAGSSVNIFLYTTSDGRAELSGDLPGGLEIAEENHDTGKSFYLRGTPVAAGAFNFVIRYLDGAGAFLTEAKYSIAVNAASPALSYEKSITVTVGAAATISVGASTGDAGTLSYKWYSGAGGDSMLVMPGQTSSGIVADTSKEGTIYYRCEVTNTNNSSQATTLSDMICVTVNKPELTGISINTMPGKQEYKKGESVNTDGLKLALTYSNGTAGTVSDGYTVSPLVLDTAGTQKITISYKNFTCSYPVIVSEAEQKVQEIKIVSLPQKTEYAPGETISLDGLKIRVITDKETKDIITGFFCTPTTFYDEGRQTVTVFYGESKCSFDITVKKAASETPQPSPSPSATPAPAVAPQSTSQPSQTPVNSNESNSPAAQKEEIKIPEGAVPDTEDDGQTSRSVPRLTVAIFVIAIVALACLGVYAFVMQNPKTRKAVMKLFSKQK